MRIGVLIMQPPANGGEIVIDLCRGHAGFQSSDYPKESLCPIAAPRVGCRRIRHHDFRVADEGYEVRPQHADDRESFSIQDDWLADRIDRPAEMPLPHAMADER